MPPRLPPKFCMPETVPTLVLEQTACVSVQVFGEHSPRPHREIVNSQTAVILSSTRPAGQISRPIQSPTTMNVLRTRLSDSPRLMSRSLIAPESRMMTDIARYGTEL